MDKVIVELQQKLGEKVPNKLSLNMENNFKAFYSKYSLSMPDDLTTYFKLQSNSINSLNKELFTFYTFDQFLSIDEDLALWNGVPNYSNLVNVIVDSQNCFVFADYSIHLLAYAIRLYPDKKNINEIYLLCGDKYKTIAKSFSEFLSLYFSDSLELTSI